MSASGVGTARARSIEQAVADAEMRGLELAMRFRLAGIAILGVWVLIENAFPRSLWLGGLV